MSLFDKTNQNVTAFQNSAPFFPATIGESNSSVYNEIQATETSDAFHNMEFDMFERYRDQLEELTGDRMFNPMDESVPFTGETPGGVELNRQQFFENIRTLREKFPGIPERSEDLLLADIVAEREKFRQQRAEVSQRETSVGNTIAGFIGGAGAVLSDPLILGSMVFGAPAATTILRAALIEGAIGAGSEVAVQAAVQATRERVGEGADFGQAATNILLAGVGGGVFAGAIRGGMAGTRALLRRTRELPAAARTPEVKAAERYLSRQAEMEDTNPFGPSLAGQMEHAKRLDHAMLGLVRPTKQLLQDGTAIGRVLPVDEAVDVTPVRPSESMDQYVNRVRQENRDLFAEIDTNSARVSDVDARINQIDDELAAIPEGDAEGAIKLTQERQKVNNLKGQKRTKTVQRKLARAERSVEKLEARPEVGDGLKRLALTAERVDLVAETKTLTKQAKGLTKDVKKAVKKTKRQAEPTAAPTRAAIDASSLDSNTKGFAHLMADLGEAGARSTDSLAPLGRDAGRRYPIRDALDIDPELEKFVKDEARVAAELRASVEEHPDRLYEIEDPQTGAIRQMSGQQVLDDLAEDQELITEFGKCLTGAVT